MITEKEIIRDPNKIPKPRSNPAVGLIEDTLEYYEITAAEAARAMQIPRSRFSEMSSGRKGVSADTAFRMERYLGLSAKFLLDLQADFDFSKAYHSKRADIAEEVQPLDRVETAA